MKEEYIALREMGYTNSQIATKYNCSQGTVNNVITAIVEETGMPRENFLDRRPRSSKKVQKVKTAKKAKVSKAVKKIDLEKLDAEFNKILGALDQIKSSIAQFLD